ncbi:hypothetical protein IWW55_001930 [Coemansia sp. RSA 2706]|nr:hypothetical protein LPJ63_001939 [Coemansia sp. RSA 2711]KAJ1840776.1 hypothetical protein LPJ70_004500 [Coemansia sp. RSA 2708]KAJ2305434.1 hypothetical protein IWW55_001930 [Coemansia sp. RSA 2706]KAJ2315129.1 hypothetical protein IWW54_000505 [Coemansia sp. RSA 2705]KAJ2321718.1 hypothetical protein IWW52_000567 [Coemansia sp. RSA 2704]KAJ2327519.1 hypothetical protein IWW51_001703 [Coemansia sp. RSA 2702]KAJ2368413.1 hypothetical protein H4S01_001611 [Coemansia sp. RSA 2610]KAJ239279
MKIFDGYRAWFSSNVPVSHVNTWLADGGVQIRDVSKSQLIQYYFSNTLEDPATTRLLHEHKVVYTSAWITDSSLSRTKQPLGAYALASRSNESPRIVRRPPTVVSERRYTGGSPSVIRYRDDDAVSMRSRGSSRHSNASSVVSYSRRQQQVVSRFVIHADHPTRMSILANVADFTPNSNGFVAYKIPKMT